MNVSELACANSGTENLVPNSTPSDAAETEVRFQDPFDLLLGEMFNSKQSGESFGADDAELRNLLPRIAASKVTSHSTAEELATQRELLVRAGNLLGAIRRIRSELYPASLIDEQTNTYNRRGFLILGAQLLRFARRIKRPVVLLCGKFEEPKEISEPCGRRTDDGILIQGAAALNESFRKSDIVARLDCVVFGVLAIETGKPCAKERFLRRVEASLVSKMGVGDAHGPSLSFGIARFLPANPVSLADLLSLASRDHFECKSPIFTART